MDPHTKEKTTPQKEKLTWSMFLHLCCPKGGRQIDFLSVQPRTSADWLIWYVTDSSCLALELKHFLTAKPMDFKGLEKILSLSFFM